MMFIKTPLEGAFVIDLQPVADERGFFARTWDRRAFVDRGLDAELVQCSIAVTPRRGTLRGLHFQVRPFEETKLVRCPRGAVYDVIVDLRRESPTYRRWFGVELSAENHRMLYIPKRFAHGYQTLTDDVEFAYQMSAPYSGAHASGVRWDDPAFGIKWPETQTRYLSTSDRNWPLQEVKAA
jgi:dTDP-4-dehydrorhamnose 3,5-epimerase